MYEVKVLKKRLAEADQKNKDLAAELRATKSKFHTIQLYVLCVCTLVTSKNFFAVKHDKSPMSDSELLLEGLK